MAEHRFDQKNYFRPGSQDFMPRAKKESASNTVV